MTRQVKNKTTRALWSSRFSFVMVTAGAAVGLGNIWKFPYMAGENGGGAFVLLYLFFVLLVGIPVMIAEILLGRQGRQNPVNSFLSLAQSAGLSHRWQSVGWLGAATLLLVLSFYSVISGWSLAYLYYAIKGVLHFSQPAEVLALWDQFLSHPGELLLWHSVFMFLTLYVVGRGVNAGIERVSDMMLPALFIVLFGLVCYAAYVGNFREALTFLLDFRLQDITPHAIIAAMGQAFFTLATGAGALLIYGSYLSDDTNIVKSVFIIAGLDVLTAIFAGLAIFPIVFFHGLEPVAGPGLMFKVLPIAFSGMPAPTLVSICFFVLLLFAAWTSSISMAEPLVALIIERTSIKRGVASLLIGIFAWGIGIFTLLSFNVFQDVKIFHWSIFEIFTDLPTNIMLPIGALLICIFAGWKLPKEQVQKALAVSPVIYKIWRFNIRYITPLGIFLVFLTNL
ncbi:MAG TPA: sodium-dependent transporter [Gammaproteobacteria bacterium]|nr:sodium-dependent transporter [Gammaproteobacteria bacterium]